MKRSEYEGLIKKERDYQEKISKIVGVPFAVVAFPSWVGAFIASLAFGVYAIWIAVPGLVALFIAIGANVVLTRRSEQRQSELQRRYDYGKSPELTD